ARAGRSFLQDGSGRATVAGPRRPPAGASFASDWHNPVGIGTGPAEGIDSNRAQIVGEDLRVRGPSKRTDDEAGAVGLFRDIAGDSGEQVGIVALHPLELIGQRACVA